MMKISVAVLLLMSTTNMQSAEKSGVEGDSQDKQVAALTVGVASLAIDTELPMCSISLADMRLSDQLASVVAVSVPRVPRSNPQRPLLDRTPLTPEERASLVYARRAYGYIADSESN